MRVRPFAFSAGYWIVRVNVPFAVVLPEVPVMMTV